MTHARPPAVVAETQMTTGGASQGSLAVGVNNQAVDMLGLTSPS